jgi:hypothetical protein
MPTKIIDSQTRQFRFSPDSNDKSEYISSKKVLLDSRFNVFNFTSDDNNKPFYTNTVKVFDIECNGELYYEISYDIQFIPFKNCSSLENDRYRIISHPFLLFSNDVKFENFIVHKNSLTKILTDFLLMNYTNLAKISGSTTAERYKTTIMEILALYKIKNDVVVLPSTDVVVLPSTDVVLPSTDVLVQPSTVLVQPSTVLVQLSTVLVLPSTVLVQPSTDVVVLPSTDLVLPYYILDVIKKELEYESGSYYYDIEYNFKFISSNTCTAKENIKYKKLVHPFAPFSSNNEVKFEGVIVYKNDLTKILVEFLLMDYEELETKIQHTLKVSPQSYKSNVMESLALLWD